MSMNFRQFFDEVQARRDGKTPALAGTPTPENPQAGGSGGFDHSQASYGSARVARQDGGVGMMPQRVAGFRA